MPPELKVMATVAVKTKSVDRPETRRTYAEELSGRYAARCNNCIPGEAYPDNVAVHVTDPGEPWAQWRLHKLGNGNYALQSMDTDRIARQMTGAPT